MQDQRPGLLPWRRVLPQVTSHVNLKGDSSPLRMAPSSATHRRPVNSHIKGTGHIRVVLDN